jgi:hypothetical protein
MGLPFGVNAYDKSIVPVAAIEGRKEPAIKPAWQPPKPAARIK